MKDRIRQIMESQHMTQQVFAQFIGMSPASLSSIFNERTKPSLNIVEAIKKKIPDISTDWLMFGSGPMYIGSDSQQEPSPATPQQGADQSRVGVSEVLDFSDTPTPAVENAAPATSVFNSVRNTHPNQAREDLKIIDKPPRRVTEIRVFYDDQTWESFVPAKK